MKNIDDHIIINNKNEIEEKTSVYFRKTISYIENLENIAKKENSYYDQLTNFFLTLSFEERKKYIQNPKAYPLSYDSDVEVLNYHPNLQTNLPHSVIASIYGNGRPILVYGDYYYDGMTEDFAKRYHEASKEILGKMMHSFIQYKMPYSIISDALTSYCNVIYPSYTVIHSEKDMATLVKGGYSSGIVR